MVQILKYFGSILVIYIYLNIFLNYVWLNISFQAKNLGYISIFLWYNSEIKLI